MTIREYREMLCDKKNHANGGDPSLNTNHLTPKKLKQARAKLNLRTDTRSTLTLFRLFEPATKTGIFSINDEKKLKNSAR